MEKEVIISIKGMQKYENAEPDTIELVTGGRLERDGESFTLSYQESAVTGMDGTLTTFQIEPERVTLLRVGEYTSQMVFQEGRRHMSMYNTPYGTMSIGVNTRHLTAQVGESGGDIEIDYAIEIDHTVAGRNVFQIKIKEAAPGCSLRALRARTAGREGLPPEESQSPGPRRGPARAGRSTTRWRGEMYFRSRSRRRHRAVA